MSAAPETVVLLASTAYDGHQLTDQRLARALAADVAVLYVDPPIPFLGLGRSGPVPPHRRTVDGLTVLSPRMLPRGRRRGLAVLTAVWVALLVRWSARRAPRPALLVAAAHPLTMRLLPSWRSELLLKDDYVAGAGLIKASGERIARHRRALLALADEVVVVSPVLAETAGAMGARSPVHIVPPGCDPEAGTVDVSALLADVPGPRAVFIGMVSDRIDFDVLEATCAAGVTVVAVGRQQPTFSRQERWTALVESGALRPLGERSPEEVASLVRACDVGLVPYTQSDFNRASFPLKLLEYLAAGTPVIASDLPAVRWLAAPHVQVISGRNDVPGALASALADASDPATARECAAFAAQHTWARRARRHVELLAG